MIDLEEMAALALLESAARKRNGGTWTDHQSRWLCELRKHVPDSYRHVISELALGTARFVSDDLIEFDNDPEAV